MNVHVGSADHEDQRYMSRRWASEGSVAPLSAPVCSVHVSCQSLAPLLTDMSAPDRLQAYRHSRHIFMICSAQLSIQRCAPDTFWLQFDL